MKYIVKLWKKLTQPSALARWVRANTQPVTYKVFYPDDPSKYVRVTLTGVTIHRHAR